MRVMIDTNIIISAALFPNGRAAQAFRKTLVYPFRALICDYVVEELHDRFSTKFADRKTELEAFLYNSLRDMQVIPTPVDEADTEYLIRDIKDRPILRAALDAHADLFLTGDKDFLESSVTDPRIISAASFLDSFQAPASQEDE